MGCKSSYQEKTVEIPQDNMQEIAEKFRAQRENRLKYMENRPKLNVNVRKLDSHDGRQVNSPAVFMAPSHNYRAEAAGLARTNGNFGIQGRKQVRTPLNQIVEE